MSKLREKTTATLLIAIFMISTLAMIIPVMAKPPTYDIDYYQTQFQWRAGGSARTSFGTWSYGPGGLPTIAGAETSVMRLTGNVLHSSFVYSPSVTNSRGLSTIYVNDGTGHWILREGKTSYKYTPIYGPYTVVNYWRGYMDFSGVPSTSTFTHGVLYQWAYIMKSQKEPVQTFCPDAVWDPVMNAWLVGFSIYWQDPLPPPPPPTYSMPFPTSPFPIPKPANNCNPLVQ